MAPDPRVQVQESARVRTLEAERDRWAEDCKMWADAHSDLATSHAMVQAQRDELRTAVARVLHHGNVGKQSAEQLRTALEATEPNLISTYGGVAEW